MNDYRKPLSRKPTQSGGTNSTSQQSENTSNTRPLPRFDGNSAQQSPSPRPQDTGHPRFDRDADQRGEKPRPDRPRGAEGALIDLDRDIMKLLVRRATLLSRIRGGKDHAATPAAVQAEKTIRLAWEASALAFSKDPRFTRDLFSLLQDIKVISKETAESRGSFQLSPTHRPVSGTLTGPSSPRVALMWTALAGVLGKPLHLRSVLFSDAVVRGCKTFAGAGANLEHSLTGHGLGDITLQPGAPLVFKDAGIHAGDNPLVLYLLAFMAAGSTGSCRFTGGNFMKNADLSGLRHTLPLLGARLAHVIPRSQGLPAIAECSGMIPNEITVPADLPLDGVCALLLAPLAWNVPVILNLGELSATLATAALAEVEPLHQACGAQVQTHGSSLHFTPTTLSLPHSPRLPLDPALAAYLLALPALTGGGITLNGQWPTHLPQAVQAEALLAWAGVSLDITEDSVSANHRTGSSQGPTGPLPAMDISPCLSPLFFTLSAIQSKRSSTLPSLVSFENESDTSIAQEFLSRIGFSLENTVLSPMERQETTWVAPDAFWSMGFALAAFAAPGLQLANPKVVTAAFPPFWPLYNALPTLLDPVSPIAANKEEPTNDKPARRRIITE